MKSTINGNPRGSEFSDYGVISGERTKVLSGDYRVTNRTSGLSGDYGVKSVTGESEPGVWTLLYITEGSEQPELL